MASWCLPGHGSGSTKGKPAAQLGCCYKTKGLDGSEDSLSPRLDFQLHQEDQVLSADTSQPLPDTTDACDLSRTDRMSPLLLAPAKSSLLACPQGLCALQKTPLARVPQDLREDRKHQPPGLREGPADSERLTSNRDEMGSQPGRCPCPPLTTSSSPDARLNRKSSAPLSFWPWLPPSCISKELPTYIYPPFPGYPLLPPPYLFAYEPLPFSQCSRLLVLTPDTAYPTVGASSLLMTANGAGPHITQEKTLFLYSRAFQSAGHTLHSQVRSWSSRDASTPGRAGVAAPAKRAMPGSRAGAVALPYPLKKENGKILYECNVCGKSFGQLSNLKVHLRVHSGERPFQCDLCQKTFTQLAHLQKHHLVHTREQPHQRQMCHKRSSSSGNLKTHLRLHSGAQSSQCRVCPSHLTPHIYLKLHQRLQASRDPWPGPHPPGPLLSQLPCPRSTRSCGSTIREEHRLGCAQGQGVLALPGEEQGQPGLSSVLAFLCERRVEN